MSDERIPTNLRALRILEAFAEAGRSMTPTELNAYCELPKPTIHRLCHTLEKEGLLIRDVDGNSLRPARRLRRMAAGLLSTSKVHIVRHKILEWVAHEIGETCNLVMPDEEGMRYLDRVETHWPLRFQLPVGSHVPFHCTATGKLFLSSFDDKELERMLKALVLTPEANQSIRTEEALWKEVRKIREAGYSLDNEEFIPGMVAAAVPILDPEKRFFAALAFHAPKQRVPMEQAVEKIDTLKTAARRMEAVLFNQEV